MPWPEIGGVREGEVQAVKRGVVTGSNQGNKRPTATNAKRKPSRIFSTLLLQLMRRSTEVKANKNRDHRA